MKEENRVVSTHLPSILLPMADVMDFSAVKRVVG